jgi:MerR family transcriptional regulator, light-induced transcriptional regulator
VIAEDEASVGPAGCVLTIRQASCLLTVPVSTLRSWERRYDVPMTARTTGGHRRYTKLAIDELRLMRDEIARGKRAGEAAVSARLLLQPTEPARPFIDAFLVAAQAMQPARVRVTLDDATSELGLGAAIDEVLMPAMRRIGRRWETGRCGVGHEHLATDAARTWLGKIVAYAPEPQRLAPVVLACGPRDTHTLGLEALGALLVHSGRPCWVLGARTPVTALVSTIGRVEPAAVVVVSHLSIGRRLAAQAVHNAAMRGVPTFYAGNAFISASTRHRMRGQYLGDSLRDAARVVERVSVQ